MTKVGTLCVNSSAFSGDIWKTSMSRLNLESSAFFCYWFQEYWTKTQEDNTKILIYSEFQFFVTNHAQHNSGETIHSTVILKWENVTICPYSTSKTWFYTFCINALKILPRSERVCNWRCIVCLKNIKALKSRGRRSCLKVDTELWLTASMCVCWIFSVAGIECKMIYYEDIALQIALL